MSNIMMVIRPMITSIYQLNPELMWPFMDHVSAEIDLSN